MIYTLMNTPQNDIACGKGKYDEYSIKSRMPRSLETLGLVLVNRLRDVNVTRSSLLLWYIASCLLLNATRHQFNRNTMCDMPALSRVVKSMYICAKCLRRPHTRQHIHPSDLIRIALVLEISHKTVQFVLIGSRERIFTHIQERRHTCHIKLLSIANAYFRLLSTHRSSDGRRWRQQAQRKHRYIVKFANEKRCENLRIQTRR